MSDASRSRHGWKWYFAVLLALVLGAFVAGRILEWQGHGVLGAEKVALKIDSNPAPVSLADFKNGFTSVLEPALPKVVNISSTKLVKRQFQTPDFFNDPLFRQFFGDQLGPQSSKPQSSQPQTDREYSLGSGVIVNSDGYVLTNNHVVAGASDVEVFTQDHRKYKAKLVGTDPRTDIAVLKIDTSGLPIFALNDSSKLKVGDIVFAIGNPFGVGETATMGIVSATGRGLGGTIERYEDFIQTDAAINPGNSGGALIDIHGDLIGINTAIVSGGGGGNQGVGFAIPINMARNVMEQILEHGKVIRGHLGVSIQGVDPDMAKAFGLSHGGGALVGDVTPGSPAAKAGIERGDIILELNGQAVNGPDDLSVRVSETPPGSTVHLKIFRNGQTKDVAVTLGELSEKAEATPGEHGPVGLDGVQVENLTPALAGQLGLPTKTTGVVVSSVDPSSPAAAVDLEKGDVIQEVNRKPVRNVAEYQGALAGTASKPVLLLINRSGTTRYVVVQPH
jgi:serine protease Do